MQTCTLYSRADVDCHRTKGGCLYHSCKIKVKRCFVLKSPITVPCSILNEFSWLAVKSRKMTYPACAGLHGTSIHLTHRPVGNRSWRQAGKVGERRYPPTLQSYFTEVSSLYSCTPFSTSHGRVDWKWRTSLRRSFLSAFTPLKSQVRMRYFVTIAFFFATISTYGEDSLEVVSGRKHIEDGRKLYVLACINVLYYFPVADNSVHQ